MPPARPAHSSQKLKMKSEPNAKPTITNFWPVANWIIFWVVFQLRRGPQILTYHHSGCMCVCVWGVRVLFSCCQAIKILCQCRNRNLASFTVIYRAFSASPVRIGWQRDRQTDTLSKWQFDPKVECACVCMCVWNLWWMLLAWETHEKTIRFAESFSWEKIVEHVLQLWTQPAWMTFQFLKYFLAFILGSFKKKTNTLITLE